MITVIEERKQTTEYEGFIKESPATGHIEMDQVTVLHQVAGSLGPGGIIDKTEQPLITAKVLAGDNMGGIQLIDTQRKLVVDRFKLPALQSRRIMSLSTCSIDWVGTQLTYVAVAARGLATVHILVFKHSDCKIRHLYSFNLCPDLANPDEPELNSQQKYSKFPYEVKLSPECAFLSVTLANGEVKVIRMPAVLNPLEPAAPEAQSHASQPPPDPKKGGKEAKSNVTSPPVMMSIPGTAGSGEPAKEIEMVKPDLDKFTHQALNTEEHLIVTIPARHKRKFVDPFQYHEEKEEEEALADKSIETVNKSKMGPSILERPAYEPTQALGNKRILDKKEADAGCLYKLPEVMPTVNFIRASCIAKSSSIYLHSEMQQLAKGMKQFFVTTGICLSYHEDFEVHVYNIQKPTAQAVLPDLTYDYFSKLIQQRKLLAKKKVEKNLASLVAQINATAAPASAANESKQQLEKMRSNCKAPARVFKMPYPITATAYRSSDEEAQSLAVGLMDGAIVVIDLALGMEKFFLEKHPTAVSSLAFYEDKVLISGSIDGRVNLCDLDSENQEKVYKCQNL